jgi:hypothetical protein
LPRLRLSSGKAPLGVPVCAFEQGVTPFDPVKGLISDEVGSRKVTLAVVDDAEQSPGPGPVDAAKLRRAAGIRVDARRDGIDEAAEDRQARVGGAGLPPCGECFTDGGFPEPSILRKAEEAGTGMSRTVQPVVEPVRYDREVSWNRQDMRSPARYAT